MLPSLSTARANNVCVPATGVGGAYGDVQLDHAPLSIRHSKVEGVSVELRAYGAVVPIVVSGSTVLPGPIGPLPALSDVVDTLAVAPLVVFTKVGKVIRRRSPGLL